MKFSKLLMSKVSLLSVKMFDPKVFIPYKYVIISSYDIWMQKPFSIPPTTENSRRMILIRVVIKVLKRQPSESTTVDRINVRGHLGMGFQ